MKSFYLIALICILNGCTNEVQEGKKTPISNYFQNLDGESFSIDPTKDTIIQLNSGTTVRIMDSSFVDASSGIVLDSIEIEFLEFSHFADIIYHNLSTLTENAILESAGMMYVNAYTNSTLLRLRRPMSINYNNGSMPNLDSLSLYRADISRNYVKWSVDSASVSQSSPVAILVSGIDTLYHYGDGVFQANNNSKFNYAFSMYIMGLFNLDREVESVPADVSVRSIKEFDSGYYAVAGSTVLIPAQFSKPVYFCNQIPFYARNNNIYFIGISKISKDRTEIVVIKLVNEPGTNIFKGDITKDDIQILTYNEFKKLIDSLLVELDIKVE